MNLRLCVWVAVLCCFGSQVSRAGDNIFEGMNLPFVMEIGDEQEVEATWRNGNPDFGVSGLTYSFQLSRGTDVLFEAYVEGEDLEPEKEATINFGSINYQNIVPGFYTARFDFEADFDANPENNVGEFEIEFVGGGSDWAEIRDAVMGWVEMNPYQVNLDFTSVYLCPEVSPAGTTVMSEKPEEFEYTTEEDAWFGWINWDVTTGFSSRTTYVFVDDETQEVTTFDNTWYPAIKGEEEFDPFLIDYQIKAPNLTPIESGERRPQDSTNETVSGDSICALLVVGKEKRKDFQEGLEYDAETFKWGLTKNPKGPRLPSSSVVTLNQPHPDTLCNLMKSMKGKYKKIYFNYTGHGDTSKNAAGDITRGWMCFGKRWMTYEELLRCLYDIEAKDICISIDACFAGSLECFVKKDERYKNHNIELIMSSSKRKTSYFGYVVEKNGDTARYSTFSRNFAFCSADVAADKNDDGTISRCEAFNWVKTKSNNDQWNRDLDSLTKYRKATFAAQKVPAETKTADVTLKGTDIEIRITDKASIELELEAETRYDWVEETEELGDSVFSVSTNRIWDMSITEMEWTAQMTVTLNEDADNVPTDAGVMGLVYKEEVTDEWMPMYPSVYNAEANTVTATEPRTGSYLMRVADVVERLPTSVYENSEHVYAFPNPVSNVVHVPFEVSKTGVYMMQIVNAAGETVELNESIMLHAGSNVLSLDVSAFASGVYFVEFNRDEHTVRSRFVKK